MLHDFGRTAIAGLPSAGVSEKEARIMAGATADVIRRHCEKMDKMVIAKRSGERRLAGSSAQVNAHRQRDARKSSLDDGSNLSQTASA